MNIDMIINIDIDTIIKHKINSTPFYNKTATATTAAPNGTPVTIALPATPTLGVSVAAGAVKLSKPPVTVKV
jgi:hypothetical protein